MISRTSTIFNTSTRSSWFGLVKANHFLHSWEFSRPWLRCLQSRLARFAWHVLLLSNTWLSTGGTFSPSLLMFLGHPGGPFLWWCMVTFEIDLKGEEGLQSGDVRPLRKVEVDSEPGDGYLCPSCPFPWWALHYPSGRVVHRKGRTLFDPPHGQPKFQDKGSRWGVHQ